MLALVQKWLARLTMGVSALLIAWVALFILYGVGARYILGSSPIWFDELARYSIIAAAMIGVGAVWVEGAHMRVSVVEDRAPAALRRVIILYQWLLTLGLTGAMAWFSYEYVGKVGFFKTQGLQISRSVPVAILPVGFGLLFLMVLLHGPRALRAQTVEDDE
ncbi:TRAP transporter small permease [Leisingera sp.]|jgi:TRAP-type C4-dicarboxylate transport system permease small subunit|uniref:TRAP transporter small permease n=1 Tax=Leisingera sp. TaxID=1879318 RepID=UPI003A947DB0